MYFVEAEYVKKFTEGDAAHYAASYDELGIDVDDLLKKADIPRYVIDLGTDPGGRLLALAYQGTGSAFIYRRSIAKDVWGTDDPEIIKNKIGPGWDRFFEAAAELKAKGYGIVSGYDDIWYAVKSSADTPWIVDGKLNIDPKREAFLDLAKRLRDGGYTNNTKSWTDEWYDAMSDNAPRKIFGFLGPSWFVNYVLDLSCGGDEAGKGTYGDWAVCEPPVGFFWGGFWVFANKNSPYREAVGDIIEWITLDISETGFQYSFANGTFDTGGIREAVTSGAVMRKVSGESGVLGHQDMFVVFDKAARLARGDNITQYDILLNSLWVNQAYEYAEGRKTREQAIEDFKKKAEESLGIPAE